MDRPDTAEVGSVPVEGPQGQCVKSYSYGQLSVNYGKLMNWPGPAWPSLALQLQNIFYLICCQIWEQHWIVAPNYIKTIRGEDLLK